MFFISIPDQLDALLIRIFQSSAAIAGLAAGPLLLWVPLCNRIGRRTCIFWCLVVTFGTSVWSALMTDPNDFNAFIISRWLGGLFGSVASTVGAGIILDIFFLHQRGRAFTEYYLGLESAPIVVPTISGFIVESNPWPVQIWWLAGLEGVSILLVFFVLDETEYHRDKLSNIAQPETASWLQNRLSTPFPKSSVLESRKGRWWRSLRASFLIAICPVPLLAGGFLFIAFGWSVAHTNLLSVFLQRPVAEGGYAFTPLQNAEFSFCHWVGLLVGESWALLVNDRVPLWLCRRRGGHWKPEYRLYPLLLVPAMLLPFSLGLFGASLQYHLHYMVPAFASFVIEFCTVLVVPITGNYLVEGLTDYGTEVFTVLNFERLLLGLLVPFFLDAWQEKVGIGWVFGMMSFFSIFAFALTGLLAWKGPTLRQYTFVEFQRSEEGVRVIGDLSKSEDRSSA